MTALHITDLSMKTRWSFDRPLRDDVLPNLSNLSSLTGDHVRLKGPQVSRNRIQHSCASR